MLDRYSSEAWKLLQQQIYSFCRSPSNWVLSSSTYRGMKVILFVCWSYIHDDPKIVDSAQQSGNYFLSSDEKKMDALSYLIYRSSPHCHRHNAISIICALKNKHFQQLRCFVHLSLDAEHKTFKRDDSHFYGQFSQVFANASHVHRYLIRLIPRWKGPRDRSFTEDLGERDASFVKHRQFLQRFR